MIRHRPFGLGHPYRLEPDQRVPAEPVAGDPIELRATTAPGVLGLEVLVEIDGRSSRLACRSLRPDELAPPPASGHLATAATAVAGGSRRAWLATVAGRPAGTRLRYRFEAPEGGGRSRWFEVAVAGWAGDGGRLVLDPPAGASRVVDGTVEWLRADAGPLRLRFALALGAGNHVVGFGERFDRLDQAGCRLDSTVFEQYKHQGNRTYLPVPFAIVVESDGSAWGFHVRTSSRTWYDVGASDPGQLRVEVDLDPSVPDPRIEVGLYAGSPADVLAAFIAEVGRPSVPPDWVFRPWMSANEWNTESRVRSEVGRSLAEGIPVGVVVIEAWSDESTFVAFRDAAYEVHRDGSPHRLADFTFPPDGAWPNPRALVEWLHERGVRVLLWQIPLLKARPKPRSQARADGDLAIGRGLVVRDGDGRPYRNRGWWFPGALLPDWTNPEARAWWLAKRRYLVEEVGIDGFKTDGGEHAWGHDLRYADGTRGEATNNRYPVLYAAAYHELLTSLGREPVTFSRAGFTGAGSYPLHWAGDEGSTWEAFRASITAGLTAGASGVFVWGWDLAGFSGPLPSAELYLRAAAMACFCPVMQYHAEFNHHRQPPGDRTPWNVAERTADERVLPVYRRFARLRDRLVPYLARSLRRSIETGRPLMRALFFDWPDDPDTWRHPYQYVLGDDLLVAPVVEPGVKRWPVYLPAGRWMDAWNGSIVAGPQVVDRAVPIEVIPLFVRADGADTDEVISALRMETAARSSRGG